MAAQLHSTASRADLVTEGTVKRGLLDGLRGAIIGGAIGIVGGAASSLANPLTWVGGVAGLAMMAFSGTAATAPWVMAAVPIVHAAGGMLAGMGIGGGIGGAIGGVRGAMSGGAKADMQDQLARQRETFARQNSQEHDTQLRIETMQQVVPLAKTEAAQEVDSFYKSRVIPGIIAAYENKMKHGKATFVDACCANKKPMGDENHAQVIADAPQGQHGPVV